MGGISERAEMEAQPGSNEQGRERMRGGEPATVGLAVRCYLGGLLMGFANLVPGISGGAMLLIAGVYTKFVSAVADVTTLRWRWRSLVTVGAVGTGAVTSILILAGIVKHLIVHHRFETFSVFIGMRLAAVPMVWKLARPATTSTWVSAAVGVVITGILATFLYQPTAGGWTATNTTTLFLAGTAGASATILPGLDGSYLLMLLGQYVPILGAIDRFGDGLKAGDLAAAAAELWILVPVGVGVLLGIGGVSVILRWLMERYPKPTFGLLLGIVAGAFIGLWPFARYVPPEVGAVVKGVPVTAENVGTIKMEDWPLEFFAPSAGQGGLALALIAAGFGVALLFSRIDPEAVKGKSG